MTRRRCSRTTGSRICSRLDAPTGLRTPALGGVPALARGLPALGYRALALDDDPAAGLAVFRWRRRGGATEAGISELLVPAGNDAGPLLRAVRRQAGADYVIRLGRASRMLPAHGFVPLPRHGPVLTYRPLADASPPPSLRDFELALGDVELL